MFTFTLLDADGQPHEYEVALHKATDGQPIMWELYALAAGPLSGAVGALAGSGKIADVLDTDLSGLDFGAVGEGLSRSLLTMPKLTPRILAGTFRDKKRLFEGSDSSTFDAAYRGNYFELVRAVWEVVQANRFLPLSAISEIASRAKAAQAAKAAAATSP